MRKVSVGCEVMELQLATGETCACGEGTSDFQESRRVIFKPLLSTSYKQDTMDDMDTSQHEVDPLSDPEERRVLYSALDSFR